jgi:hypothetical protein
MSMPVTPLEQTYATNLARLLFFRDLDARRTPTRRVHELARRLARDLGGDLSVAKQALVLRVATLICLCEHSEVCLLTGREVSIPDYLQAANTLKRLLQALGLERVAKSVTDLETFLETRERAKRITAESSEGSP